MSRNRSITVADTTFQSCRTSATPRTALDRLRAEHRMLVARGAIVDAVRMAMLSDVLLGGGK